MDAHTLTIAQAQALIRHIDIDEQTGDAYKNAQSVPPAVSSHAVAHKVSFA